MTFEQTAKPDTILQTVNPNGSSDVVLVCEHATNFIPDQFDNLGLSPQERQSHVAWDPGAAAVAGMLSQSLDAVLVQGVVSRLVYDCNRPPSAPSAMPERSEIIHVPGNRNLTKADKSARVTAFYDPFQACLADVIAKTNAPIIVTIHSFTPIYNGQNRAVEIGVLHDSDTRLADAFLNTAVDHCTFDVQRNEPYGPEHGVTHTLTQHAIPNGHLNVMLEIRNDLISTHDQQQQMAQTLAKWLIAACQQTGTKGDVKCVA